MGALVGAGCHSPDAAAVAGEHVVLGLRPVRAMRANRLTGDYLGALAVVALETVALTPRPHVPFCVRLPPAALSNVELLRVRAPRKPFALPLPVELAGSCIASASQ